MKGTGIIRRIDDLGRIVVTKEIRRRLNIHEGDALELFTGEDFVAFKKYDPEPSVRSALDALRNTVEDEPALKDKIAFLGKIRELYALLDGTDGGAQ